MSEERNRERYAADLAYEYDLSLPQGRKLAELAIHALDPTFAPDAPAHLADPAVAVAYLCGPLGIWADDDSVASVEKLARDAVRRGLATAGAWLAQARVAEHRGDLDGQRSHLATALALDGGFGPALADLGFLAFVEGDVARARRLLQACGDDRANGMLHTLSHHPPLGSPVGRNEPCPCGSGAKRTHCCTGPTRHPLSHRAGWLWEKAGLWSRRPPQQAPLVDLAARLGGAEMDDDDPVVLDVLQCPIIESVSLLDAGQLRRFLDRLGCLLPADEHALAEAWTSVRHRAWRVDDTVPGSSLVLTDLGDGATVEAVNGSVSRCTQAGELVFAAVVPTPTGWLLPCHPVGMTPGLADAVTDLVVAGIDPLDVAATVVRGARSAAR